VGKERIYYQEIKIRFFRIYNIAWKKLPLPGLIPEEVNFYRTRSVKKKLILMGIPG